MNIIKHIMYYQRAYKNWISIIYQIKIKKSQEIILKFRDGNKISVQKGITFFLSEIINKIINKEKSNNNFSFDPASEIFTFNYNKKIVKMKFFKNGRFNGELTAFSGDYDFLQPLKGNTVIDIGMNIADSAVWFKRYLANNWFGTIQIFI